MDRDEALGLIALGLLNSYACSRQQAPERAEELLAAYLRDPLYRVEGVDVPEEFVADVLANA